MEALYQRRYIVLILVTLLALSLRLYRLDAAGISEDESHKLQAVAAYKQGDYSFNGEHPMVMKVMVSAALTANERLGRPISTESALRLPNVIFGALTTLVLYLFFSEMFGFQIGLLTALLWATNGNAIQINRWAKEDTLLVFFMWLGYYCCRRAKRTPESEAARKGRYYALTGVSFALMIASKYFPHYMGLNFLYYHLIGPNKWNEKIKGRYLLLFFAALAITFLIANPPVLMLSTIKYMIGYVHERTQTHHGYWMMGQLFLNDASSPVRSTPVYFYLLLVVIKTPLPLLIAFLVGLVEIFRRRGNDDYFFVKLMMLLWLVPFSLFGAKWYRYLLSFLPLFSVITAIGITQIYNGARYLIKEWLGAQPVYRYARGALASAIFLVFLFVPFLGTMEYAPFYSLYVNSLGGGHSYIAYYFPHDELYDVGLREAVKFIAAEAEDNAIVANEAPGVIEHYRDEFGRADLRSEMMSHPTFELMREAPIYVLVQDGRRYFENEQIIAFVESNYIPVKEVRVRGASAVRIYKIEDGMQARHRPSIAPPLIVQ